MKPSDRRKRGTGPVGVRRPQDSTFTSYRNPRREQAPRPHRVLIVAGTRRGEWGRFADLGAATGAVEILRRHGLPAIIESDEETSS